MAVDLERPGFVGRLETVDALRRRYEDARAGSGGVTFLVGDTGVGKSTLVAELVHEMEGRGIRVLEGRAVAADAPPPFQVLREALVNARERAAASGEARGLALEPEVLIGFAPGLEERARGPVRVEERILTALGDPDEPPEGGREALWEGLARQFREFVRQRPTALILEDLHRADDPSLDAIEFVARQLREYPFWILATVRPFSELPPARRGRLEKFEKATDARRVVLQPLTSGEVAEFLHAYEPEREFTDEEVARRYSETGGNPLLLLQLDRRIPRPAGEEAPGPDGATPDGARPPAPVGEEEERVVAVASVVGPEVPFALLLSASGEDEERLAELVDRLVGRGLLLERPGERLLFVSDRVRSELYERLTETRRRLLHRRVGAALETTGTADAATIYVLARHYYLGRVHEKSLRYNRAAADIAAAAHAPGEARRHLERALESFRHLTPDDWTGETDLVLELAQQMDFAGEFHDAETLLRRHLGRPGLARRVPLPLRALAETFLARVQTDLGDWKGAEEVTRRLLSTEGLEGHPLVLIALRHLRGESLFYLGRYAEALAEHDAELALARATDNARAVALGQVRRASVLRMLGRLEEALTEGREAGAALARLGDLRGASHAHMFVGVLLTSLPSAGASLEEALAEFHEATRLGEEARDPRRVGWALFNAADVLRGAGRLDEAASTNVRARDTLERIGDRFGLVQSLIIAGKISLDRREFDRAEADLLDAYRIVRELGAPADEVDVVLRLAQLSFARGDLASARRRVKDLERLNLAALRPDVADDFERLVRELAGADRKGGDGAARPG
ncbi:MAG TPA: AAA family ATPase [Thermoplasmata archaeon]|nr:AAA family ATPase [Thermoplasmata archaeon]